MTACLLVGTQFFLVLGSIWKTWARVLKMGCSLRGGRHGDVRTPGASPKAVVYANPNSAKINDSAGNISSALLESPFFASSNVSKQHQRVVTGS